jgi:hypothetical protein
MDQRSHGSALMISTENEADFFRNFAMLLVEELRAFMVRRPRRSFMAPPI